MSSSNSHSEWLDDELRSVPVPAGMTARLRQIAAGGSDDELDAQLSTVPVPRSLIEMLHSAVVEARLDETLADVPIPVGFATRLSATIDDAAIDERLADVPIPARLVRRLSRIPRRTPEYILPRLAVAAALVVALGSAFVGPTIFESLFRPQGSAMVASSNLDGNNIASNAPSPVDNPDWSAGDGQDESLGGLTPDDMRLADVPANVAYDEPLNVDADAVDDARWDAELLAIEDRHRQFQRTATGSGVDPLANALAARVTTVFTADNTTDELPPLETVAPRRPMGATIPTVREFDRLTLARTGIHPFVDPSKHELLQTSEPPLTTQTTSYDRLWDRVLADRTLTGGRSSVVRLDDLTVRPEDFLAALDYRLQRPVAGQVALRTAAGPAPFAAERVRLLQIGVQAGAAALVPRGPTHLTLAVDVSGSMRWQRRLTMVRDGLSDLAARLEPGDRLTLVAFSDGAEVKVAGASTADIATIRRAIEQLVPQRGTNLGAGLQAACDAAGKAAPLANETRRIIVLTDAPPVFDAAQTAAMQDLVRQTASRGIGVTIADLSGKSTADEQLTALARAALGRCETVASSESLRQLFRETITGKPQIVARGARVSVRFNPKAVAEYRLIGHEPAGDLAGATPECTLYGDQAATVVYQVVLAANDVNDVATVELSWRDPVTRRTTRVTQRISRVQFAASFSSSAISLQAAALACEAAEVLRATTSAGTSSPTATTLALRGLDRVRSLAAEAHPQLQNTAEFRRFLDLLGRLRTGGGPRTGA